MDKVTILPAEKLFNSFIADKYIPKGKTKYYLRDTQVQAPEKGWRHLTSREIEALVKNENSAYSWDTIYVTDEFEPSMIKNNKFYGLVRIGRVTSNGLQYHDLRLACGITNSSIHSCDIGNDVAIHNVRYLSHYIIGDKCMLFNIDEMQCTDHAKFGNGIIKEGESEETRIKIEVMNETGCRPIYPFDGMLTADAYLWAKYIDDKGLMDKLATMTQNMFDSRRGYYGVVGESTVIKSCSIIKDVKIGSFCYIKGASKIKNVTINSSEKEPSQIGENVILVNGIVGYGCKIFYSCIAIRFVLCSHSNLKYGARLVNSFMGENSTISCCEVLHNLIFPAHEQHHNNSFLIASVLKGQTNLAAGATIGSNHNSRTNDNEIEAGRGFWPGLCTSVKHSCRFASYVLLSKSDYPAEMNIPFPFSLLRNAEDVDELHVMPAFWWRHNMFALARNNWKYANRDKRLFKVQNIEFDAYAPDSMTEVREARRLLEIWTAKAHLRSLGKGIDLTDKDLALMGKDLLTGNPECVDGLEVLGENMEKSRRKVRILKPRQAYQAYADILVHYAMKNMVEALKEDNTLTFSQLADLLEGPLETEWTNLGGQLVLVSDVDKLREDIRKGTLSNWKEIHKRYNQLWKRYPRDKQRHAYALLKEMLGMDTLSADTWNELINREIDIQHYIAEQVYASRKKDYDNPFRQATYRNREEMISAIGEIDDNGFIAQTRRDTQAFIETLQSLRGRI